MTEMDVATLCARLEALEGEVGRDAVLAFDADGTLWEGDVTRDLVSFVMGERPLLTEALPGLSAIAEEHGLPLASDVHQQLAVLLLAYSSGQLPEECAVRSVLCGFAGHRMASFEAFVDEAIRRANLASRFRVSVSEIFDWAAGRGIRTIIVSASPRVAVGRALTLVGLKPHAVLGAHPRAEDGRLRAELAAPVLVGSAKVEALRAFTERAILAAFGDDVRDLALLASGRLAVAIHPTEELLARGSELDDLTVLSTGS